MSVHHFESSVGARYTVEYLQRLLKATKAVNAEKEKDPERKETKKPVLPGAPAPTAIKAGVDIEVDKTKAFLKKRNEEIKKAEQEKMVQYYA